MNAPVGMEALRQAAQDRLAGLVRQRIQAVAMVCHPEGDRGLADAGLRAVIDAELREEAARLSALRGPADD